LLVPVIVYFASTAVQYFTVALHVAFRRDIVSGSFDDLHRPSSRIVLDLAQISYKYDDSRLAKNLEKCCAHLYHTTVLTLYLGMYTKTVPSCALVRSTAYHNL